MHTLRIFRTFYDDAECDEAIAHVEEASRRIHVVRCLRHDRHINYEHRVSAPPPELAFHRTTSQPRP